VKVVPVSLCLIARNEEHCIANCLNSVRHLVAEIIVADTGSTDQTKAIAREYGASVLDYCWQHDFAAARNFALRQARGEWILVLDADEMLAPVSCHVFFQLLSANSPEGYYVKICSFLDEADQAADDFVVRLFKNKPEYKFEGVIHEQVAGSIKRHNAGNGLAFADLTIHHFGYLAREVSLKSKFNRNTAIINKALLKNPHDPFLHYSLGIEYLQRENVHTAVAHLYKALLGLRGDELYFPQVLFALILGLIHDPEQVPFDVEDIIQKAVQMVPDSADFHYLQGFWLPQRAQYEQAAGVLETALQKKTEMVPAWKIYALRGDACCLAGHAADAEHAYFSACRLAPQELYSLMQMLGIRQRQNNLYSWEKLNGFASLEMKRALRDALCKSEDYPLALVLAWLSLLDSRAVGDAMCLLQLCNICRIRMNPQTGEELWNRVINILAVGAEEACIYAQVLQNGWASPLMKAQEELERTIYFNLQITVALLCDRWSPGWAQFEKGAGIDEACINC